LSTIEDGEMTSDLAKLANPVPAKILDSWEFIEAVSNRVLLKSGF